jgi:signal-transduction protein with cAMP-binding, CBS, and nucleotidyltransferase domain
MKIDRVYSRHVVGVSRSSTVEEAAAMMRLFHVGTLVVADEDRSDGVAGIVTDRDLVVQVLAEGLDGAKVAVERVMSPVVASIEEGSEMHEALERMRAAGVRRLLVTKTGGGIAGIVSMDDIIDGLVVEFGSLGAIVKNEGRREAAEFDSVTG